MQIDVKSLGIGLAIGLFFVIFSIIWMSIKRIRDRKAYNEANQKLKNMLADKMDVESEGISGLKEENEKLRKENENLRISLNVTMQKPGNKEMMRAEVLQRAIDKLLISSPGFGTAWGVALNEAEVESAEIYEGKSPFFKRVFSSLSHKQPELIQAPDNEKKD